MLHFVKFFTVFVKRSGITGGIGPGLRGKMSRRRDILFTILHTDFREFRTSRTFVNKGKKKGRGFQTTEGSLPNEMSAYLSGSGGHR